MEKSERVALGRKKEPPQRVTVLRLISPASAAVGEVLGVGKAALGLHLFSNQEHRGEKALLYLTFTVSSFSSSFITG